jgi:hypothetical protein
MTATEDPEVRSAGGSCGPLRPLVLGIDLGADSVKVVLPAVTGHVMALASKGHLGDIPHPGHAESSYAGDHWHWLKWCRQRSARLRPSPPPPDRVHNLPSKQAAGTVVAGRRKPTPTIRGTNRNPTPYQRRYTP